MNCHFIAANHCYSIITVVNFVVAVIKSTIVAIAVVNLVITAIIIAITASIADYFLVSLQYHSDHAIKVHFLSKKTASL